MENMTKIEVELDGMFLGNDTYDYKDYKIEEDNFLQFTSIFIPILYSVVLVGGLLGNGLVLVVLCCLQRSWTYVDAVVLHLSVADVLLLVTLPFWAAEAVQGWSFSTPLCKLMGAMFKIKVYCSIFLLTCLTLGNYLSNVHAMKISSRCTPWHVQALCFFVWFFCLILSIPDWIFLEQQLDAHPNMLMCTHNYLRFSTHSGFMSSRLLYLIVGFFIPFAVIVFCYFCILLRLYQSSQSLQKHRSLLLILALVLAFFICWTPFNVTLMVDTLYQRKDPGYAEMPLALRTSLTLTTALGCLHALLNPMLYTCLCAHFRHHLLHRLRLSSESPPNHGLSLWDESVPPEEKYSMNQVADMTKTCY